jgi:hypothetical protein
MGRSFTIIIIYKQRWIRIRPAGDMYSAGEYYHCQSWEKVILPTLLSAGENFDNPSGRYGFILDSR